jgi:hypothetical protein
VRCWSRRNWQKVERDARYLGELLFEENAEKYLDINSSEIWF